MHLCETMIIKSAKVEPMRVNHLDDVFYRTPHLARKTLTAKQLRETLLYNSDGRIMACGYLWSIVSKSLGAGMYLVTLKEWK